MSHTYRDPETGVVFHYNSDLSGEVGVCLPDGTSQGVSGDALRRFIMHAILPADDVLDNLGEVLAWFREMAGSPESPSYPEEPLPKVPTEQEVTDLAIERDRAQSRWLEAAQRRENALDVRALIKSCCLLRKAGEWDEAEDIYLFHDFPSDEVQGILNVLATMDTSDIEGDIP
jgi:hypothetical protein